jgi:hypothetical protein
VPCTIENASEIGPVDVQIQGGRLGVSSMDSSLKIYDIEPSVNDAEKLESKLIVDSNMMDQGADAQYDASKA